MKQILHCYLLVTINFDITFVWVFWSVSAKLAVLLSRAFLLVLTSLFVHNYFGIVVN